jgi:hypothetical protein
VERVRRAETLEALVELYLRLNGYFCIRNYLQHRTASFGLETESDVLALRMPHQQEELPDGRVQPNDDRLVLRKSPAMADCIIAEVKEPAVEFNKSMRGPEGVGRIAQAVRMFGVFADDLFEKDGSGWAICEELHRAINKPDWSAIPTAIVAKEHVTIRMMAFAPREAQLATRRAFIDLEHVLDFVRGRMKPAGSCSEYRGPQFSPWRGTTGLIVSALDVAHGAGVESYQLSDLLRDVLKSWPG